MGDRDRTGISSENYQGSTPETTNPPDNFYFSDIKLRIHQDDNFFQGKTAADVQYAAVNQDARYPDGKYDLYAKATTVKNAEHESDKENPTEIEIDNFRPYITNLKVEELVGNSPILLYEADWIWNGDFLCYGTQDSPIGNVKTMTDATSDILITLETSEAMTSLNLKVDDTGNGQGFYFTANNAMTSLNSENTKWQIIVPNEQFPEFANGIQTLHITGHDKATTLNNLLGFSDSKSVLISKNRLLVWQPLK
ncbi:MAG: hypothetical protein R3E32_16175 [Chitinophagales bacterium]